MIDSHMAKDKYSLPEVDFLKEIGFQFEFSKLDEVIPYLIGFVGNNTEKLILHYFPDQYIYDDDGNTLDLIMWADPTRIDDELYDEKEKELIEKIIRIEKGDIKLSDYALLVHAKFRKDKKVILKALNKRLRYIYGATGNLVYRFGIWNLDFVECVTECLYHRVLDDIIFAISSEGKIGPSKWNPQYFKYLEKKSKADKYKESHLGRKGLYLFHPIIWKQTKNS